MTGNTAWNKWSSKLAISLDRDFERECLPFLRLLWPDLIRPRPLAKWDRQGIDLISLGPSGAIDCVAQCKTSQREILGKTEIRRACDSISKFQNSGHKCDTYLFIINGDGRNKEHNAAVQERLDMLVKARKARRAEFWPRSTLMNHSFERMKKILLRALRRASQERQAVLHGLFRFGHVYLPEVPVQEDHLLLKKGTPCERRQLHPVETRRIADLLQDRSDTRWTLLTGVFGSGKTTTALQASSQGKYTAIFVAAADLAENAATTSTNAIAQEMVNALHIFEQGAPAIDGFQVRDSEDEQTFVRLAGPALASLLRSESPEHVLVLDGLDENRVYLSPNGFQLLNNHLADLKCPIVLTTRFEHLSTMFGNFEALLAELGSKGRSAKPARLLSLAPWSGIEVRRFVHAAMACASDSEQQLLTDFIAAVGNEGAHPLYGQLPTHPLFLQFILDDICNTGIQARNRTELIRGWIRRKIWRDLDRHGFPFSQAMDRYEFVGKMCLMTEMIAGKMTSMVEGSVQLNEYVDADVIKQAAGDIFEESIPLPILLLYGFFVPRGLRRGLQVQIAFALRILHELFLAVHVKRSRGDVSAYPHSVKELIAELTNDLSW